MKQYIILYFATLMVMTGLDITWIGGIAKDFYKNRLGTQMELHVVPAVLFYLMYVVGVIIFVSAAPGTPVLKTLLYGALFGFFCYGTYDLTNLATLKGWPLSLVIVDMIWGTFVTAVAATAGRWITDYFVRG